MNFWKLHGIGNDFIAIDGRNDNVNPEMYGNLAKMVCHRRFSVGADGLLVVKNSDVADVEMVYYNSDGSRAKMCGNGIRCFCRYVYDKGIVKKDNIKVYTLDGVKNVVLNIKFDEIDSIKVNMGKGSFFAKDVPVISGENMFIEQSIEILDKCFKATSVLMGVPHTVVVVDDFEDGLVVKYGRAIELSYIFPQRTNVNFVRIIDRDNIQVRTWERGCGYTYGCGTGMTASAMVLNYLGYVNKSVNVRSEGGEVRIDLFDNAYMTGSAVKICEGILEV